MLRFLSAGESHGPAITAVLDGMPAGLPLSPEIIDRELARRQKGYGAGARMKIEKDTAEILSGVMAGHTTGAPIALLVRNADHARWKGKPIAPMTIPRPGHADMTGAIKYGYNDLRPALERASARNTATLVALGSLAVAPSDPRVLWVGTAGGEPDDAEAVRVPRQDVQGLGADRPGRAEEDHRSLRRHGDILPDVPRTARRRWHDRRPWSRTRSSPPARSPVWWARSSDSSRPTASRGSCSIMVVSSTRIAVHL